MRDPVEAASKGCSRANHYSFRESSSAKDSRYGAVAEEEALHLNTLDFQRGRREGVFGNRASRDWLILFRQGAKRPSLAARSFIQIYLSSLNEGRTKGRLICDECCKVHKK